MDWKIPPPKLNEWEYVNIFLGSLSSTSDQISTEIISCNEVKISGQKIETIMGVQRERTKEIPPGKLSTHTQSKECNYYSFQVSLSRGRRLTKTFCSTKENDKTLCLLYLGGGQWWRREGTGSNISLKKSEGGK